MVNGHTVDVAEYANVQDSGEEKFRGGMIPALDPAQESDFNSFWDIRRFQLQIRFLALLIRIHHGSRSTSGFGSVNGLI